MKIFFSIIKALSRIMSWIAAVAITSIVFLTVADVILRRFGRPIDFTYEVIIHLGAIAIAFSIPQTTLDKGHVIMDFLTEKLPQGLRKMFSSFTRFLGIGTFAIFGWRSFLFGNNLWRSGEVTAILEMPTYPVVYGIGVCCFVECLVLLNDMLVSLEEGKA
jgi:TRAP-type C4-dicarboxylate transport system permease small subunit